MIGMAGNGVKNFLNCKIQTENVLKLSDIHCNHTKHVHQSLAPKVATN